MIIFSIAALRAGSPLLHKRRHFCIRALRIVFAIIPEDHHSHLHAYVIVAIMAWVFVLTLFLFSRLV